MSAPSQATVTYVSTLPSTTSTIVLPITPNDVVTWTLNLVRAGGCTFTDATGLLTWIPLMQIVKVTFA